MATKEQLDNLKAFYDTGIDIDNGVITLNDEVNDDMLERIRVAFHFLRDKPVTLVINSGGGEVWAGMGIIDNIKSHPFPVTTKVNGVAASMACVIMQAGARRIATKNAILMHHVGSMGAPEDHYKNVKKLMAFNDKYNERVNQIMLDRINEKRVKAGEKPRDMAWWKEYDTFDRWMTAEEALEMGFIDEVEA